MSSRIRLDTADACERELERCTNGMALLDHLYTQAREAIDEAEVAQAEWDAIAVKAVAPPKGMTVREIDSRVEGWYAENPEANEARKRLREIKADLDKIDRWFKTAEKRSTNASAAMKKHVQSPGRYGGSA